MTPNDALQEVKRMAVAFRAFEHAQNIIEMLANSQQVQSELSRANDAAREELNALTAKVNAAKSHIDDAKSEAKAALDAAKIKAATLAAKAEAEAETMRAAAKAEFDETQALLTKMREEAANVASVADKSRAEVAALEKRMAEVRGKLQAFLGE